MRVVLLGMLLALLAACGGGGGGSAGGSATGGNAAMGGTPSAPVAIDLATAAPSAQTVVYGVEVVLALPSGLTVSADPASGVLGPECFSVSDGAALAMARYLPASGTAPASLVVKIADPAGFLPGSLASIICTDASGGNVSAAALTVTSFNTSDKDGHPVPEVTWRLSVRKL